MLRLRDPCHLLVAAFLALVLPLGIVLAMITPPGQVADEVGHIERATALSEGHVLGRRSLVLHPDGVNRPIAGVDADPATAILAFGPPPNPRKLSIEEVARAHQEKWRGEDDFLQIGPLAVYLPIFYLPSAAGIGVARLLGMSPFHAVVAGRLAELLAYGVVGLASLLLARRGRALLFCTLAVPMAISLGASLNQDGLLIAVTALAAALVSRGPEDKRARLGAAALICAVATVKLPYLVLATMLLLPVGESGWRTLRAGAGLIALVAVPALAWTAYALWAIAVPVTQAPYQAGPLWPGPPGTTFETAAAAAQLRVLGVDPLRVFSLPLRSIATDPWLARQTIGLLGWLIVPMPGWLYALWAVAVGCAMGADGLGHPQARPTVRLAETGILILAVLAGVIIIYVSQYLVWTEVGAARVAGPQGRYLLPLVPMLALAVPRVASAGQLLRTALCAPAVLAALGGLAVAPGLIVAAFYLR
ncbi:MAG: DUF2142 domain-containing protein [Geminicoccaceae bacterium]